MRSNAVRAAIVAMLGFGIAAATAQTYPSKPIRLINPFGSGGAAEALARTIAKGLSDGLAQPVIVEPKPGATGTIGANYVAKSPPDGYTILYGVTGTNSIAPSLYRKLPYDPEKDLAAISIALSGPNVLIVNPELNVKSVQELIALAKSNPGSINFSSSGNGSSQHLNGELFKLIAGIDIRHVPYKGGGSAMPDLLGGRVQMTFEPAGSVTQLIRSGRVLALAVTTAQRSPQLPDVPTMAEIGLPRVTSIVWGGLFAPGGTPRPILDRIAEAIARAARDPAYRELVASFAMEAVSSTPDQFQAFIKEEIARYGEIVRRLGLGID